MATSETDTFAGLVTVERVAWLRQAHDALAKLACDDRPWIDFGGEPCENCAGWARDELKRLFPEHILPLTTSTDSARSPSPSAEETRNG